MSNALKSPLTVENDIGTKKLLCVYDPIDGTKVPVMQPEDKQPTTAEKKQTDMDAVGGVIAKFIKKNSNSAAKAGLNSEPNHIILRVAAYIRVSSENQEDSYETQEKYFTNLLAENPDWSSAGIYFDYGISATSEKNRVGFQRLLRHCKEGRIDRIIVKSISRFARNTVDFLEATNLLKECGVTVLFEKEALDTADFMGEFVLTVLAAIAQEESRSISANIRWGIQARYPKGDVTNCAIYGYRFVQEGDSAFETTQSGYTRRRVEIVEEEAAVVRRIFEEAAAGVKFTEIARNLNNDNVPAPPRKRTKKCRLKEGIDVGWTGARIGQMIRNERYCGDVKVQKSFTESYLNHKQKVNKGERTQYYVKNHHPAIVSRKLFESAQSRKTCDSGENNTYPLSGTIICAHCGRVFNVRNSNRNPIWFCPSTVLNNGKTICRNVSVYEEQILSAIKKGLRERFSEEFVTDIRARLEHLQDIDYNESDRAMMQRRAQILSTERSRVEYKRNLACTKLEEQTVLTDVLGEGHSKVKALKAKIADCDKMLADLDGKEATMEAENDIKESYWQLLEESYKWRAEAIQWMKTLPDGREGIDAFLEGLTTGYVKAFILSIVVHDGKNFTIRWFDGISTDVKMQEEITDHIIGHDYF